MTQNRKSILRNGREFSDCLDNKLPKDSSNSLDSITLDVPCGNYIKTRRKSKNEYNYVTKSKIKCNKCDIGLKKFMKRKKAKKCNKKRNKNNFLSLKKCLCKKYSTIPSGVKSGDDFCQNDYKNKTVVKEKYNDFFKDDSCENFKNSNKINEENYREKFHLYKIRMQLYKDYQMRYLRSLINNNDKHIRSKFGEKNKKECKNKNKFKALTTIAECNNCEHNKFINEGIADNRYSFRNPDRHNQSRSMLGKDHSENTKNISCKIFNSTKYWNASCSNCKYDYESNLCNRDVFINLGNQTNSKIEPVHDQKTKNKNVSRIYSSLKECNNGPNYRNQDEIIDYNHIEDRNGFISDEINRRIASNNNFLRVPRTKSNNCGSEHKTRFNIQFCQNNNEIHNTTCNNNTKLSNHKDEICNTNINKRNRWECVSGISCCDSCCRDKHQGNSYVNNESCCDSCYKSQRNGFVNNKNCCDRCCKDKCHRSSYVNTENCCDSCCKDKCQRSTFVNNENCCDNCYKSQRNGYVNNENCCDSCYKSQRNGYVNNKNCCDSCCKEKCQHNGYVNNKNCCKYKRQIIKTTESQNNNYYERSQKGNIIQLCDISSLTNSSLTNKPLVIEDRQFMSEMSFSDLLCNCNDNFYKNETKCKNCKKPTIEYYKPSICSKNSSKKVVFNCDRYNNPLSSSAALDSLALRLQKMGLKYN